MRVETQGQVLHIEADPNRLEKILLNLLTNAIKFTQPADTIVVGFCQDEDSVRIEVKDTGVGIAEHNLSKIFERFHQVDASSTRKYQGVGIGLSLTKDLVEKHGGELSVKIQRPIIFLLCLTHELKALCVGADLGGVKCLTNRFDHLGLVSGELDIPRAA